MTEAEVDAILASAEAELNANEEAMLITPLALVELIGLLRRCERARDAAGMYDEMHFHEA